MEEKKIDMLYKEIVKTIEEFSKENSVSTVDIIAALAYVDVTVKATFYSKIFGKDNNAG